MKKITSFILAIFIAVSFCSCDKSNGSSNHKDTVFFDKKSTRVIAHRGLSGLELENTKEAFTAAGKRSYFGIEADVRKTSDGKFIICHDETLTRIANVDLKVEESTFEELINTELKPQGNNGQASHLCELETYISICKTYSKHAVLELKSNFTETEISRIIEIINSYGYLESVTFISFNYTNLEYVRKILPGHSVQFLFSTISDEITARLIEDKIDAAISYKILTEDILTTFHNAGLTVNCWTVDDKNIAENLSVLGVDYITTNVLE